MTVGDPDVWFDVCFRKGDVWNERRRILVVTFLAAVLRLPCICWDSFANIDSLIRKYVLVQSPLEQNERP